MAKSKPQPKPLKNPVRPTAVLSRRSVTLEVEVLNHVGYADCPLLSFVRGKDASGIPFESGINFENKSLYLTRGDRRTLRVTLAAVFQAMHNAKEATDE